MPRGGGLSYTGGYVPRSEASVLFDTRRLDRIIEINADDMYVTAEAGCTWAALYDALTPFRLRPPHFGPASGRLSTIGGSLSQHSAFFGSGLHGTSADSTLSLEVVLANGDVLRTGSAAADGAPPFLRTYGPDLTGLFLGDCGGAVRDYFNSQAKIMARHGITATLTVALSLGALLIEPVLYWRDALRPAHLRAMSRGALGEGVSSGGAPNPEDPEATKAVADLRGGLRGLFLRLHAAHLQVGKFYAYREALSPTAWSALEGLKRQLDPKGLMNPGALGLE